MNRRCESAEVAMELAYPRAKFDLIEQWLTNSRRFYQGSFFSVPDLLRTLR